jgi:amino acid adenylation domain-containing protein
MKMTADVYLFPLSFSQQRIWMLEQFAIRSPLFNLSTAVRFNFTIDVNILKRSLDEVIHRHESLRTTIQLVDGEPQQVVASAAVLELPIVDLSHLDTPKREQELIKISEEEASRLFDLHKGPLIRARLIRLAHADNVLVVTMHHIISDGWSIGIFWRELSCIWKAYAAGGESPLQELPIQYGDYAIWQKQRLSDSNLDSQMEYWRKQLADLPVLDLPTDRVRPVVQSFHGAREPIALSAALTRSLIEISQREGVTLFMTLVAAFQTLLYRYTGQADIAVGSYIAGRNHTAIEGLIGIFLNTLVLRTDFNDCKNFRSLLARVRRTTVDAYANQDVPFAKLVEELRPPRDISRNPLCQVLFQLMNIPTLTPNPADARSRSWEVEHGTSIFDLTITLIEHGQSLTGHVEYCTDLFEAETILRMIEHFKTLLESVVSSVEDPLERLEILKPAERDQLIVKWNATERYVDYDHSIIELFEDRASRIPDMIAFQSNGRKLTYKELNKRANQVAHKLCASNVEAGDVVAVCLDRSFEAVIAIIGILKAGAGYLPLDPSYPFDRLLFMLKDARASVLIVDRAREQKFISVTGEMTVFNIDLNPDDMDEHENLGIRVVASDLAYVIYTSGSTGSPKGVIVDHRQVQNRLAWMWKEYPFSPDEVACQKTALSFVDSIWELFGGLLQGIPTVIIGDDILRDPGALVECLTNTRVTRLWLVPSFLKMMIDAYPDLKQRVPQLNFWVSSGEPLTADMLARFQEAMPGSDLFNLYGASEFWDATWFDPRRANRKMVTSVPIGRPISNVETYILDPSLNPVPIGVPGELYIGGAGLARGYVDRPDIEQQNFIPHLFSTSSGTKLYRTGDLARYLADGNIELLGRKDLQVKLRGFRIELGEVEASLRGCRNVRDAVTILHEKTEEQILVSYVVMDTDQLMCPDMIRTRLKTTLPDYMIPSVFVAVPKLPLTPSGKVDRRSLPACGLTPVSITRRLDVPTSSTEQTLKSVWKEILSADDIGTNENFFDIGGHSLLMFKVHSKLAQAVRCNLSITDLFRYPTIRSLANFIDSKRFDSKMRRTARSEVAGT